MKEAASAPDVYELYKKVAEFSRDLPTGEEETEEDEEPDIEEEIDKSYREKTVVNGIEMKIGWSDDGEKYEIYFPQIKFGKVQGVGDQTIGISQNPDLAKEVFGYASAAAKLTPDVYELYKKVDAFTDGLLKKE